MICANPDPAVTTVSSALDGDPISVLCRKGQARAERDNLCADGEALQAACKRLDAGWHSSPHVHLPVERSTIGTQEAWVVIEGRVRVEILDLDGALLDTLFLNPGDCLVLLRGGHSLTVVEHTLMYEFKNGPYLGQEADKRWL